MNSYIKRLYFVKPSFFVGLILLALTACRVEPPEALVANPPTQRVKATKVLYLGIYGRQPSVVDTVLIQGKSYQSTAFDSTTFRYDPQERLIRLDLLNVRSYAADYPGDKEKTLRDAQWTEYVYQGTKLLMRSGFGRETASQVSQPLLDGSQRRIASRSWYDPAGFTNVNDTLRVYSEEGLLISSQRILTRSGFPRQTIRQLSLVKASNIVQTSTSSVELGQSFETTTYEYDISHMEPLATMTIFGESSRNPLLRATTVRHEQSGTTSQYEYTYYNEYDEQGRLICQTEYFQSPPMLQREIRTLTKFYYQ